jgi:hypothetical protein
LPPTVCPGEAASAATPIAEQLTKITHHPARLVTEIEGLTVIISFPGSTGGDLTASEFLAPFESSKNHVESEHLKAAEEVAAAVIAARANAADDGPLLGDHYADEYWLADQIKCTSSNALITGVASFNSKG